MGMLSGGNRHVGDLHHHFDHFDHHDRFHHHDHDDDDVIFISSFGFPFWGWWDYPYYYGYYPPYGYDPYGSYGYGSGYGNGYSDHAKIADLQDRLAHAGYYHGPIDGIFGPRTRSALRAYRHDHGNGGY
jgi:hypothetical protein